MASNKYETKVLKSPSIITIQKNEHEKKVKTLTATKDIEKISINELKQKMLNLNDFFEFCSAWRIPLIFFSFKLD